MKRGGRPTVILVHEHAGVLELVEAALRDRGTRVHATLDPFEALEVVRRLKVDLLVTSREHTDLAYDLRQFQPELSALVLGDEPMSLEEIEVAVATALTPRAGRGKSQESGEGD